MRIAPPRLIALATPLLAACAQAIELPTSSWRAPDASRDGAAPADAADVALPPVDPMAPAVSITAPTEGATLTAARTVITGRARSGAGVAAVEVRVASNAAALATTSNGFVDWRLEAAIPYGEFTVEAVAIDNTGRRSAAAVRVRATRTGGPADTASPVVRIDSPADNSTSLTSLALVRGAATDDRGVVRMEVRRNGVLLDERPVQTDDFFARWARLVPLDPGMVNTFTFTAFDARGGRGEATVRIQSRAEIDRVAPAVAITTPRTGDRVAVDRVTVTGTASDNSAMREVKVRAGAMAAGATEPAWGEWFVAQSSDGLATWRATLPVPVGAVVIQARAIDAAGLATTASVSVTNAFMPAWSDETAYPLRLHDGDPTPTVTLSLDRAGVNAVIAANIQQETTLLRLDPGPLLTNALNAVKTACGTGWRLDRADPGFDCSLTPLGRTFRGADGRWQSSPEFALVRLLTMTSANVDVTGTSIAQLRGIADALRLGGGFSQILADTLMIARTREIVSTASVVTALRTRWMLAHPAVPADGTLPITLYDAMNDLTPLSARFGPAGAHPGVLDPSSPPRSVVFGAGFRMLIVADSNLRWLDGLQMARGKDYMATVVDRVGPTFNDVLEFDFTNPTRFDVQGLTPTPTVDMRFRVNENPAYISACTGAGCQANTPAAPRGTTYVWSTPRYQLEHIVGSAALTEYATLRNTLSYVLGAARIRVGQDGNPPGWTEFFTLFSIGSPPAPQYVWELVNEVGQRALHRVVAGGSVSTIAEGNANVAFTLTGIPVGLTADQIRVAVRPVLQSQASRLSSLLLGDYSANNGQLDFYYRRGADGVPYVFFAAMGDPRPMPGFRYTRPGFFSADTLDPATKVSRTDIAASGDSAHEKLRLNPGETVVYAQDEAGAVYRLRFLVMAGREGEITVAVSRRLR
jgi:hypothetical protein